MDRRKPKHIDYDKLLKSLHSKQKRGTSSASVPPNQESAEQMVSKATRRRASKLSNPLNGYAYSTAENVIHDRTCKRVARIRDECFEMSDHLIHGMKLCNLCKRKAWIRQGMGDDTKFIDAYERFFRESYVSNELLCRLFVNNEVKVKIIDIKHMMFDVNGEKWIWERVDKKIILYHNSYIISDIGTRVMRDRFHKQRRKPISAESAANRMLGYSWNKSHVMRKNAKLEGNVMTKEVSVTDFRTHIGRYLDMVVAGDTLIITKYGKAVAMMMPMNEKESLESTKD